ncbi:MAG TPA: sulfite exporter TauE/SafE family protein [Longimicrobium sp.]
MGPAALVAVFGVGVLTGLLAGLVGIGGGVLMVPFLYLFYAHPGWSGVRLPPDAATLAAHATSLFVILPTSLRGTWVFQRRGMVEWRAALPIAVAAAVSAVVGAQLAEALAPRWLRLGFGLLLCFSAVHLARTPHPGPSGAPLQERPLRLSPGRTAGVGAAMGSFSALLGVGGGVIGIPLLIHVVGVDLRRVAATSLAIVTVTSLGGVLSYMMEGTRAPLRPGWSLGYVDLAVAFTLVAGTLLSVRWGTSLNRRLNPRTLALVFAVLFAVFGVRLVATNLPSF